MVRASGFVTLVVLTRTVSPQEFGVVAAAMAVIPLVYLLADLGFSTYLLQADELDQRSLSTAFWASVAAGAVLSAGSSASRHCSRRPSGPPSLRRCSERSFWRSSPPCWPACRWHCSGAPWPSALSRCRASSRPYWPRASPSHSPFSVAASGRSSGQLIVTQWVIGLLAWRSAHWLPSFLLSPAQFRDMAAFGLRVSGVDVVATLRNLAESWIVAVTLGTSALGLLNIGSGWSRWRRSLRRRP